MRKLCLLVALLASCYFLRAQVTGNFYIGGDYDKFYPVSFYDGGWDNNVATELAIGRSSVHTNATWRGSVIAQFRYHCTNWGNECSFVDADLKSKVDINLQGPVNSFVAGWMDASGGNTGRRMVVFLRGGGTTYHYQSNYAVTPNVYDNVQNALPYNPAGWLSLTYKTTVDSYVNLRGVSYDNTAYFNGDAVNYFKGNVGIGTVTPQSKLAVNGEITAKKVRVTQSSWPDYVFDSTYQLKSLPEVERYIQQYQHLPEVPAAAVVEKEGLDLGDNQAALLKKIEELTLYVISLNKEIQVLKAQVNKQASGN